MNKPYKFVASAQVIFIILLIAFTMIFLFPLQEYFSQQINKFKKELLELPTDLAELEISFSSIHPSIFGFIELRNLQFRTIDGILLIQIDRAIVYYEWGELVQGDFLAAVKRVDLRGGKLAISDIPSEAEDTEESEVVDILEYIFANLSDQLQIRIVNYDVVISDLETGFDLHSRVSRLRLSKNGDEVSTSIENVSDISFPLQNNNNQNFVNENNIFDISAPNKIDFHMFLPKEFTFSNVLNTGILQLYVSFFNVTTSFVNISKLNAFIGYENDTLVMRTLETDFALEAEYNIAVPISVSEVGQAKYDPNSPVPMKFKFLASSWQPSTILQFNDNLTLPNFILESEISSIFSLALSDTLFPLQSDFSFEIGSDLSIIEQEAEAEILGNYNAGILTLDKLELSTLNGDFLSIIASGNLPDQQIAVSGRVANNSITLLPELATRFNLNYANQQIDVYLSESNIRNAQIGNSNIRVLIKDDSPASSSLDVSIETSLAGGRGSINLQSNISGLGSVPRIENTVQIAELPLSTLAQTISTIANLGKVELPLELQNSQVQAEFFVNIVPESLAIELATLPEIFEISIQELYVQDPNLATPQLSLDLAYDRGDLNMINLELNYSNLQITSMVTGNLHDIRRFTFNFDTSFNGYQHPFEFFIFPTSESFFLHDNFHNALRFWIVDEVVEVDLALVQLPMPLLGELAWLNGDLQGSIYPAEIFKSGVKKLELALQDASVFPGADYSVFSMSGQGTLQEGIELGEIIYSDSVSTLNGYALIVQGEGSNSIEIDAELLNSLENYALQARIHDGIIRTNLDINNFSTRRLGVAELAGLVNASIEFEMRPPSRNSELLPSAGVQLDDGIEGSSTPNTQVIPDISFSYELESINTRLQSDSLSIVARGNYRNNIFRIDNALFELSSIGLRDIQGDINIPENKVTASTNLYFADLTRRKNLLYNVHLNLAVPNFSQFLNPNRNKEVSITSNLNGELQLIRPIIEDSIALETSENSNAELVSTDISKSQSVFEENWSIRLSEENGNFQIRGGPSSLPNNLNFYLFNDGNFNVEISAPLPITLKGEGFVENGILDATLSELTVQEGVIDIGIPEIFNLRSGNIRGVARLQGSLIDPDFFGTLFAENLEAGLFVIPEPLNVKEAVLILEEQNFYFYPTIVDVAGGSTSLSGNLAFDKLVPTQLNLYMDTQGSSIPLSNDFNSVVLDGWASGTLTVDLNLLNSAVNISGDVVANSTGLTISSAERRQSAANSQSNSSVINVDLTLGVGNDVVFYWPNRELPILRSLAEFGSSLELVFSTAPQSFKIVGDVPLAGGEFFFFDQDFTIREGSILFNENSQKRFDPIVNLEAQFRGSEQGRPIRVNLEIINDNISQMTPLFSSDPLRSQEEIVQLLGGTITGGDGTDNTIELANAIASGSQIIGQIRPLVDLENDIRRTLGLDLLSFRLGAVETLIETAITGIETLAGSNVSESVSIADYLDNTTLFIGKFLGDDLYLEGFLRLEKQNYFLDNNINELGIKFSPEVRLQFDTPLFTIDWSWAFLSNPQTLSLTEHRVTFSRSLRDLLP